MNSTPFASAMRIFTSLRDAKAWAGLHRHESDAANPNDNSVWRRVNDPQALDSSFTAIHVVAVGHLTPDEVARVAGCLGYALRATLAGDDLGLPTVSFVVQRGRVTATILEVAHDSESSIRTEPDPALAFELARLYIAEGTPCRKTGRSGPVGSRLVEGVGSRDIEFWVC